MTIQIALVLGLLLFAVVLFASERLSVDIITLLLLLVLVISGTLTPREAFAGFSDEIVVVLASIFVLSGALQRTGLTDVIGELVARLVRDSINRFQLAMMTLVSLVSAFMNNTTVTAVFVPTIVGIARKTRINPSRVLMPMAFASVLGGTCTLIGTSTNMAVSGYITRVGLEPLGLFEIAPVGVVAVLVGILYMVLIGKHLLPEHPDESLTDEYAIREYLGEILVRPGSELVGRKVFESKLACREVHVLEILRGQKRLLPDAATRIEAGDILLIKGQADRILQQAIEAERIELKPLAKGAEELESDDIRIAEALITANSSLAGLTLKEANFSVRYGLTALAIYRHGQSLRDKVGSIPLRVGDLLLVYGVAERFALCQRQSDLSILGGIVPMAGRGPQRWLVISLFGAAVVVHVVGLMPLSIAVLSAALLTVLSRAITMEEAYGFINWRLIILISGMTAFGTAMDDAHSGAAGFLARGIVDSLSPLIDGWPDPLGPLFILAAFFVLTIALTQPLSNAAAALVVLPVALEAAQRLGVNPRTFAVGVMLAASISLITPFEPSCILVYGPGKYRFIDFVKVGLPLTLILFPIVLLLLPILWPFHL